jgi:hypothetical protein
MSQPKSLRNCQIGRHRIDTFVFETAEYSLCRVKMRLAGLWIISAE